MRKLTLALSAAVGLCVLAQTAQAQKAWQFGPEVTLGTNNVGPAVGARAVWNGLGTVTKVAGLGAYASFDYFFPSSSFGVSPTYWEINVDGTWEIPNVTGQFKPYVGAGIDYGHTSVTVTGVGSASTSNTGLNILGGSRFNPSPKLNLFGEVRIELRTASIVAFTIGILF